MPKNNFYTLELKTTVVVTTHGYNKGNAITFSKILKKEGFEKKIARGLLDGLLNKFL